MSTTPTISSAIATVHKRGNTMADVMSYLVTLKGKPRKGVEIIGGSITTNDPKEIAKLARYQTQLRPDVVKPIWHASISLAHGHTFTDNDWRDMADDMLTELGFNIDQTLYKVVKHTDKTHEHIHIIAHRVMDDSTLYLGGEDGLKAVKAMAKIASKYGLTTVPVPDKRKPKPPRREMEQAAQLNAKGEFTPKQLVSSIIDYVIDDLRPATYSDFCATLEAHGIKIIPVLQHKDGADHIAGLSYQCRDNSGEVRQFAAKKSLGEEYTLPATMAKIGLTFDPNGADAAIIALQKEEAAFRKAEELHPNPPTMRLAESIELIKAAIAEAKAAKAAAQAETEAAKLAAIDEARALKIETDKAERAERVAAEVVVVPVEPATPANGGGTKPPPPRGGSGPRRRGP